jgi:hypothetical protein
MQEEIDRLMMEIQRSKFTERRTEVRQPFARPVKIHLPHGPTLKAFAKDLSSQGIGIITDVEFQPKSIAVLEIHSVTSDPVCLRGEVRWCDKHGKGWFLIGWKFIAVSPRPVSK